MATANKMIWQACRSVVQGADEVRTASFAIVDFLIPPEQYANTCMAVLIRRVTCESLFSNKYQTRNCSLRTVNYK